VTRNKILLVEDELGVRSAMRTFLAAKGYEISETDSCRGAQAAFETERPDAVVIDYHLTDGSALDLLPRLRAIDSMVPLIILTGHGSIELAVRMIKEGAAQFLVKPVDLSGLLVVLKEVLENQRNRQKQLAGKSLASRRVIDPFMGTSVLIQQLREQAIRVAASDSPVLIQGETGTGKGVLALWLYAQSPRAEESFIDLNCAGLSREFLETELFGHEKGAFTGAVASKQGLLDIAHRGTVFLDEIGDMDMQIQPKLLKVIEEKRFRRLGDVRDRTVDIRLIAATHLNLSAQARDGKFRTDLYFRISTIPLTVPALRDRREDIPLLATHLLSGLTGGAVTLLPDAEAALMDYPFPGNVRELRNVLERAVLLRDRDALDRKSLRLEAPSGVEAVKGAQTDDLRMALAEYERGHIKRVLAHQHWSVEQAALQLNIPRSSLYQKIKAFGINLSKVTAR
jgi:DNA-binding NtrC family response regulator